MFASSIWHSGTLPLLLWGGKVKFLLRLFRADRKTAEHRCKSCNCTCLVSVIIRSLYYLTPVLWFGSHKYTQILMYIRRQLVLITKINSEFRTQVPSSVLSRTRLWRTCLLLRQVFHCKNMHQTKSNETIITTEHTSLRETGGSGKEAGWTQSTCVFVPHVNTMRCNLRLLFA